MARTRPLRLFLGALLLTATGLLLLGAAPATAHDHHPAGPYEFVVGWTEEPAVVGAPNGLDLQVEVANSSEPVSGIASNLTVTLMSGGQSVVKPLEPQFGTPGAYTFSVIPTRGGAYSVRVQGTVNGTAVDFTSDLHPPEDRSDLEFPASDPTPSELQAQLDAANAALQSARANGTALSQRVEVLEAQGGATGAAAASTAMLIGILGLAAGAGGVAIGLIALRKGKASP